MKTDVREQGETTDTLDYTSVIIRDITTSLTAIIASVDLLSQELHSGESNIHQTLLQAIKRNALQINDRISTYGPTIKPVVDELQPEPEPVNVREVIDGVIAMLYPQVKEHEQTLDVRYNESVPPAWIDRLHLQHITTILISNLLLSSTPRGKIRVNVGYFDNKSIIIEVNNNGKSIPVKDEGIRIRSHSHMDSKNTDNSRERKLAIINLLVDMNKGNLWLQSKNGYGTSFFFTLPISEGST